MAKRKHHHKKPTTRRRTSRRVGAVRMPGAHDAMEAVGLVVASVGGTVMQRMMPNVNPKIIAVGQLAAGFMLKGSATPLIRGVGWGLMGTGAIGITAQLGVIRGVEDAVNGISNSAFIGGADEMNGLNNHSYMAGVNSGQYLSDTGMGMESNNPYR